MIRADRALLRLLSYHRLASAAALPYAVSLYNPPITLKWSSSLHTPLPSRQPTFSHLRTMGTAPAGPVPPPSPTGAVIIYVTVPDKSVGKTIAHALVTEHTRCLRQHFARNRIHLQLGGKSEPRSGASAADQEPGGAGAGVTQRVKGLHPYEECEVVAVPVVGGSASYLSWVMASTREAA